MKKVALGVLLGVLILVAPGCSVLVRASTAKPASMVSARSVGHRPAVHQPVARYWLGVREENFPPSWAQVAQFHAAVGVSPRLVLWYLAWGEPFPTGDASRAASAGVTPLIQINPTRISLSAIARGAYDAYLRGFAAQARAFGHRVVLGFGHEMNGNWYSWGYTHTPGTVFVAAWRHIVDVFRQQHATNVTWIWTVSHSAPQRYAGYWPGSAYVGWIGIDGYFERPDNTFDNLFVPAIARVRSLTNRPILLSEVAAGPVTGRQAADETALVAGVHSYHLLGLVYFDVAQHDPPIHQDWRLEDHPSALIAFRRAVRTYFGL